MKDKIQSLIFSAGLAVGVALATPFVLLTIAHDKIRGIDRLE